MNPHVPPHSIEAEQSVLGGLLLEAKALPKVAALLRVEDFYTAAHQTIFKAVLAVDSDRQPVDFLTVSERLERDGEAEAVGGIAYLAGLAKNTPSAANVMAYAKAVAERSALRRLVAAGHAIADLPYQGGSVSVDELVADAAAKISALAEVRARSEVREVGEVLKGYLDIIDARSEGRQLGLQTGFADLDKRLGGLRPDDLVVVAGRPSMGKTTFAMNIADHAALGGARCMLFTAEMSAEQIAERQIASVGGIALSRLRAGFREEDDSSGWDRLTLTLNRLKGIRMAYDDTAGLHVNQIRARAHRQAAKWGGLDLVVVDYIQLMEADGENRTGEVSAITRGLKKLAKELACPVIALSQLNRSLEQRADKRPVMSDLRESGAIEQDADVILFLYRDEVYSPDSPDTGTAEVIVAKFRNGEIGKERLGTALHVCRFVNLDQGAYQVQRQALEEQRSQERAANAARNSAGFSRGRRDYRTEAEA